MNLLSGLKAHLWQRISAYFLLFYFPFAWFYLSTADVSQFASFRHEVLAMEFFIPTLLAVLLLLSHIWVGLRDVMLDYLPRRFVVPGLVGLGLIILLTMIDILMLWRELSLVGGA